MSSGELNISTFAFVIVLGNNDKKGFECTEALL